ncbi:heme ABC transporter ATP-binding protein [Sediminitomix flava]|uniref:Iron complex transport system ATP-binding protein n=1 Tax=Sediminitomix flava TaxID=379075 RepID=A0A316A3J8_SEDFL|nr:heme ABC transporter ATP-binding protein [Sediminitomix flava]PWJ44307.1 iron complex transport system ATP-binding protein [Sediminitomix flava]
MLSAKHIHHQIRGNQILSDLNLEVKPGELLSVLGANGAGKSTLLKILTGDTPLSEGQISFDQKGINDFKVTDLAKKRAVLSQNFQLSFPYTVDEVVMMGRLPYSTGVKRDKELAAEMMDKTNTYQFKDRVFSSLSGGEQQRVQLARALTQLWDEDDAPKYLFLDEPTSNMDIIQQQQVFELVKKLCGDHIGVLAIVHDLNVAAQFSDRMLFIKNGKEVAQGEVEKVFKAWVIEKTFSHPVRMLKCADTDCPFVVADSAHARQWTA